MKRKITLSNEGNQRNNRQGNGRRPFYQKRGNQKNQNNANSKSTTNKKIQLNKELKFNLHGTGKEKQSCSYAKVLEKICLRLQQNLANGGSSIVKSIKENKVCRPEAPTRKQSGITEVFALVINAYNHAESCQY